MSRTTPSPRVLNKYLVPGAEVFDAAGEKVGVLRSYHSTGRYLTVEKGWLLRTDIYIPRSEVRTTDASGVYLALLKGDALPQSWESLPLQGAGTTTRRPRRTRSQRAAQDERLASRPTQGAHQTRHDEQRIVVPAAQNEEVYVEEVRASRDDDPDAPREYVITRVHKERVTF